MDDDLELSRALAGRAPSLDDVAAQLARTRVLAALFGEVAPVCIGRYELERQLGAGGGGTVYVARDPELSRRVALKLLAARGPRDRMLAEAHALARLAHPHVVPIFDVGMHGDQIYLVMELVEGGTLRTWLEAAPRSVRAIVLAYREAGAGLAAAHRAGFVHRDFKPDNALIGEDERVRVVDFGLVHVDGETRAGLGTPRYMPPEQAEGGEVTAAADQYAFCASLREALRARKDASGARAEGVPRWLDDILARGLARAPADRYPSMDALLVALAKDPAVRWRRRGVAAGFLALGATTFAIGRSQSAEPPACDGGRAEIATIWSAATRSTLAARLDALATPYARQVAPKLVGALDRYATSWQAGHLDACRVHRRGAQSDATFDRRMRCLDTARAALAAVVSVAREARADQIANAVTAAGELPALERCADTALLASPVAPPSPA
ncbi:MAG TPA: serine/threonine-protein kinase, partial [Kofleriaceae bacterium]|nr:serine/threonine-protein kinase [Kofleriaceae bacterium]